MYHIAAYNIARSKFPMNDPRMDGFNDALDQVNAEAESSKGFVWRLQDDSGNATNINIYDDPHMLVNLSLWESVEDLKAYIYNGDHLAIFQRKKEWFQTMKEAHMVLWWVKQGNLPRAEEAKKKLEYFIQNGPSQEAFGFRNIHSKPL